MDLWYSQTKRSRRFFFNCRDYAAFCLFWYALHSLGLILSIFARLQWIIVFFLNCRHFFAPFKMVSYIQYNILYARNLVDVEHICAHTLSFRVFIWNWNWKCQSKINTKLHIEIFSWKLFAVCRVYLFFVYSILFQSVEKLLYAIPTIGCLIICFCLFCMNPSLVLANSKLERSHTHTACKNISNSAVDLIIFAIALLSNWIIIHMFVFMFRFSHAIVQWTFDRFSALYVPPDVAVCHIRSF